MINFCPIRLFFIFSISGDPDVMSHYNVSVLHCLPNYPFAVIQNESVNMFEHPSTIGRVIDLRLRGREFDPHGRRDVYPRANTLFPLLNINWCFPSLMIVLSFQ